MQPLIVALISSVAVLLSLAGFVEISLSATPSAAVVPAIIERLPQFFPTAVFLYAALVLLLTTAGFIVALRRICSRLRSARHLNRELWNKIFAEAGLLRLASRLIDIIPTKPGASADQLTVTSPFAPRAAGKEIRALYRDKLRRSQFYTALAMLVVLSAASFAEQYGLVRALGAPIELPQIVAELLGVLFLTAFVRLGIDLAIESLIDVLAELPFEQQEVSLLKNILAALQHRRPVSDTVLSPTEPDVKALVVALSRARRAFEKTVTQFSRSAEAVASASRTLADHAPSAPDAEVRISALPELQSAIERLSEIVAEIPPIVEARKRSQDVLPAPSMASGDNNLRDELRLLLDDLE